MRPCRSTFIGIDGQPATCVKSEGHGGSHYSMEGELWEDAEQAPVLDGVEGGEGDASRDTAR